MWCERSKPVRAWKWFEVGVILNELTCDRFSGVASQASETDVTVLTATNVPPWERRQRGSEVEAEGTAEHPHS